LQKANSPKEIFEQYDRGVSYNQSIGLYDTVRQNENFYLGEQWQGLNAPDLDKPVLNFLKRVCSYLSALLVSDDIAVELESDSDSGQATAHVLQRQLLLAMEQSRMKTKLRELVRNCIVDGDGIFYWYYDAEANGGRGGIALEVVENTKVLFGNPYQAQLQRQPYVLAVRREQLDTVRERAKRFGGEADKLQPDAGEAHTDDSCCTDLVTVVAKFYKQQGQVWYTEVARNAVVRKPVCLGYSRYPFAIMRWDRVRGSYHGRAVITGLVPNQIAVNKLWAMAIRHQQSMAFPKVFYDKLKISRWTNRVGEAVAVSGNPNDAIATGFRAGDMSAQLMELVERTIQYTKEFMGASDAALGNVEPRNTSAIIAVQNATAAPLELQKLALYQLVEDSVHIMLMLLHAHYGLRSVAQENGGSQLFDFAAVDINALQLRVEVGASAYWSQLTRIGTLDNLLEKGVLEDSLLYLQSVPDGYIPNKRALMEGIRRRREEVSGAEALQRM